MTKYKQETSREVKVNKTFIIRNKETKQLWIAQSGKSSWKQPNHAKNAFANSRGDNKRDPLLKSYFNVLEKYDSLKFDKQEVYEIVEVVPEDVVVGDKYKKLYEDMVTTLYGKGYSLLENGLALDEIFEEEGWV